MSPFILDGKRVRGRHIDAGFDFGFGYGGLRVLGKDLFSFDIKGRFELQTVSGNIVRKVQYKRGLNNAYELLTDNVKYDNALNKIIYPAKIQVGLGARLGSSRDLKWWGDGRVVLEGAGAGWCDGPRGILEIAPPSPGGVSSR